MTTDPPSYRPMASEGSAGPPLQLLHCLVGGEAKRFQLDFPWKQGEISASEQSMEGWSPPPSRTNAPGGSAGPPPQLGQRSWGVSGTHPPAGFLDLEGQGGYRAKPDPTDFVEMMRLDVYQTNKMISIDWPVLALVHRVVQLGIMFFVIYNLVKGNTWAQYNLPEGTFNAWISGGSDYSSSTDVADYASAYSYCDGSLQYSYGDGFLYDSPECRFYDANAITTKGSGQFSVSTSILEKDVSYYRCDASPGCAGTQTARANGDCICTMPEKCVFPVGIETLSLTIEHIYDVVKPSDDASSETWDGSSKISTKVHTSPSPLPLPRPIVPRVASDDLRPRHRPHPSRA